MIDLQPFCSAQETRADLHQPFSYGDWTYATDGHIAIRVPRRDDVPENQNAPGKKASGLFDVYADVPGGTQILPVFKIPEEARRECVLCHNGKQHNCPSCQCPCSRCGGYGFLEEASVGIGGAIFDWKYVKMLAALPGAIVPLAPPAGDAMPVSFDGGQALLMPLRCKSEVHVPEPK